MAAEDQFDPIDEVFSRANPNPNRVGCPGRDVLTELALKKRPVSDPSYDHLAECSPCFQEFRALQAEMARPSLRRSAIAAVILLGLLGGGMWWALTKPAREVTSQPLAKVIPTIPDSTVLDLRRFSVTRGAERQPATEPLKMKPARQRVVIVLPVGSDTGQYELRLLNEALTPEMSASVTAQMKDFSTVIETDLDVAALRPGKYMLALRRDGEDWRLYPIRLG
jgi:hypothetical protein